MKLFKSTIILLLCLIVQEAPVLSFKVYDNPTTFITPEIYDSRYNGEYLLLDLIIKPNSIIFDIGANVGDYTKHLLSLNKMLKIYSFEPIPQIAATFKKNLNIFCNIPNSTSNSFTFNSNYATIFECGFYKKNEIMPIWYAYTHDALSSIYDRTNDPVIQQIGVLYDKINIELITIDDFCLEQKIEHIDFLKIDTEGAEYDVLIGAQSMLKRKRISCIQFEYGGTYIEANYKLRQVFDFLTERSYHLYKIAPDGIIYIQKWNDSLEDYKYSNFLATLTPFVIT